MSEESRELESVGALWRKTSKRGTEYLSGVVIGVRVVVFRVRDKRGDKSPDYQVFKSEPLPGNEDSRF